MKSETCFGKLSGSPLSVYSSELEAHSAAEYASAQYNNALTPYQCNRCNLWHLSPLNRHTPSKKCSHCTGSDGRPKETYEGMGQALLRANILHEEQGIRLNIYACPNSSGWHLTKNDI
ncbi:hypothetical protein EOPP23_14750 [Endozoicomonas sp. OPT23]|uniref:hypothetical protein n=1 Tax=Endozoicomonas sp. OPT23 TaxID=2072845 RepID=UPI00129BD69A|nr:hypothetical protein [Endozoicomonas sp. OPT23]MRI34251.1 hypothetical protein [Endozoicomonas sp. OPT23]